MRVREGGSKRIGKKTFRNAINEMSILIIITVDFVLVVSVTTFLSSVSVDIYVF